MAILQTLQRTNWNKQEAAQILGLYRPTLYSKMKKHEIQDGGKGRARRPRDQRNSSPADGNDDGTPHASRFFCVSTGICLASRGTPFD